MIVFFIHHGIIVTFVKAIWALLGIDSEASGQEPVKHLSQHTGVRTGLFPCFEPLTPTLYGVVEVVDTVWSKFNK